MKETFLTQEGLRELQNKLHDLKTVRRREIAEAIHTAKEQGDLSENAEYVSAKEEQRRIETQIAALETTMRHAQIIKQPSTSEVGIGSTVKLKFDGQQLVYRIVGSNEIDPLAAKISNESPLGQSLIGRKKGDKVTIPTPAGQKECQVIEIS